ncbi:hypothetical protein T12_15690 [Trichinella patagoniensis]|uniref:Uncharacterized protein n=1 Tax=Trichinella patagoniensis TaxID=990121 RepID=A0A0V0ZY53_9BILA|nr:hypothetical protein T12_15690 [Trichinella patagoniensis]
MEFPSRDTIEMYWGKLVRLLCEGDKLEILRHVMHVAIDSLQFRRSKESVGRGEEEKRIGMLPRGLTYVPLRSHCSLIGR